jgi:hypothetical protein
MKPVFRTLVLVSSVTAWSAAEAAEYQCEKLDSSLRIAVEVKKAGHTLPCEVVAEDDRGERAVLYSAQYDRDYCPTRIERTREELEQEGWLCRKTSDDNIVQAGDTVEPVNRVETTTSSNQVVAVAAGDRTITATRQCLLGDQKRAIQIEVEDPASGKPCELIYWDDGDLAKEGEVLWRAVHDAGFCPNRLDTIVEKWSAEGWQCGDDGDLTQSAALAPRSINAQDETSAAAESVDQDPDSAPETVDAIDDRELETIIEEDAQRIGEWMEVDPDIEIAARGDLNDDGSEDAVVFLAYQSDQSAYRQYLMSYVGAEGGYELASVKLLSGVEAPPGNARVDQIQDGIIWLTLPGFDGGEARPAGFKLRDQQLIEVDDAPPASGSSN